MSGTNANNIAKQDCNKLRHSAGWRQKRDGKNETGIKSNATRRKQRRRAAELLLLCLFSFFLPGRADAADAVIVYIDDLPMISDVQAYIEQGTTMVPIRFISEQLGASVEWKEPKVTITLNNRQIVMEINNKTAMINGMAYGMSLSPQLRSGRTFVPLRFISETLGFKVDYKNSRVYVYSPDKEINRRDGFFFEADDAYYIAGYKSNDGTGLYKVAKDFSNSELIESEWVEYICLINDNLYYIRPDHGRLTRFDLTTKNTTVIETNVTFLASKGEWLYYRSETGAGTLIRTKYDGTGREVLAQEGVTSICKITDACIVYTLWAAKVMRLDFTSGISQKLTEKYLLLFSDGYGYYTDYDYENNISGATHQTRYSLYRHDFATGSDERVFTENPGIRITDVQIHNGWIYYYPSSGTEGVPFEHYNGPLTRVSLDGVQKQSLTGENMLDYAFTGKGIYYRQFIFHSENNRVYYEGQLNFSEINKK